MYPCPESVHFKVLKPSYSEVHRPKGELKAHCVRSLPSGLNKHQKQRNEDAPSTVLISQITEEASLF